MQPGIYLELTPARSSGVSIKDFKHAYLVYRREDGTSEVIRGGFGLNITVETGKSFEESADRPGKGEVSGSRPFRRLPIPIREADNVWGKMRKKAEEIKRSGIKYDPLTPGIGGPEQTSNSVVRAALDAGGIPLGKALPDGFEPKDMPGIEDNLDDEMENKVKNRFRAVTGGTLGEEEIEPRKPDGRRTTADEPTPKPGPDGQEPNAKPLAPRTGDLDGGAGGDNLGGLSGEARAFLRDVVKPGSDVDEILLKRPNQVTENEVRQVMAERMRTPDGPRLDEMARFERAFFSANFGDGPAEADATGRLRPVAPRNPLPVEPAAPKTADGVSLEGALKRIGGEVIRGADLDGGLAPRIRALQEGLNILNANQENIVARGQEQKPPPHIPTAPKVKTDGQFGPKSRGALRRVIAGLGAPKVSEALALGRFQDFARKGRRDGVEGLKDMTENAFGPLFRDPARPARGLSGRVEAAALQETLNDLGGKGTNAISSFEPLKPDGLIGPKTQNAFNRINRAAGPERLTRRLGSFLGFF